MGVKDETDKKRTMGNNIRPSGYLISEENIHHCENINKMEVEKEMNLIKSIIGMFDVSDFKLIKKRKKKEKPSTVKDLINNPDQYKLEMFVENNEIVVKIRKREGES